VRKKLFWVFETVFTSSFKNRCYATLSDLFPLCNSRLSPSSRLSLDCRSNPSSLSLLSLLSLSQLLLKFLLISLFRDKTDLKALAACILFSVALYHSLSRSLDLISSRSRSGSRAWVFNISRSHFLVRGWKGALSSLKSRVAPLKGSLCSFLSTSTVISSLSYCCHVTFLEFFYNLGIRTCNLALPWGIT
jgi:hypothetical protein